MNIGTGTADTVPLCATVFYNTGGTQVCIATIRLCDGRLTIEPVAEQFEDVPWDWKMLQHFITRIIQIPIDQARLRKSRFPQNFEELEFASEEHRQHVCCRFGPFNIISASV